MSNRVPPLEVLSIQSSVAYGHVGNGAALFPLQRLGIEAWGVNTVHFSNHTGYGKWRGPMLSADQLREVLRGVQERGVFSRLNAVIGGYQGAADVGGVIVETVAAIKHANPEASYYCDPVMGDVGRGVFVDPEIPTFMSEYVVPIADVVTPNHFELNLLTGGTTQTRAEVVDAIAALRDRGPRTVLVTSVITEETSADSLDVYAVGPQGGWMVSTPQLPIHLSGCGDLTAALFAAHLLKGSSLQVALARTTASVYAVVEMTLRAGTREIQLVATQEQIAVPEERFAPLPLRK